MKKLNCNTWNWILCILYGLMVVLMTFLCAPVEAQNVKREGKMFVEMPTGGLKKGSTKTEYTYKCKDGKVYPIYLSANGKAYIVRVSKKTGKEYKQYLPEVTKQLAKQLKAGSK